MASKVIVTEFSITFGGTAYDCKSIPAGVPEECEPVDVTVGSDIEKRYDEAALTNDGAIDVVIAAATPPVEKTRAALVLTMKTSTAGAAATSANVTVGQAIVTSVKPTGIEAGGERAQWWNVTFQPDGTRA